MFLHGSMTINTSSVTAGARRDKNRSQLPLCLRASLRSVANWFWVTAGLLLRLGLSLEKLSLCCWCETGRGGGLQHCSAVNSDGGTLLPFGTAALAPGMG